MLQALGAAAHAEQADPLAKVANLSRTALVIRAGQVYTPVDLTPRR